MKNPLILVTIILILGTIVLNLTHEEPAIPAAEPVVQTDVLTLKCAQMTFGDEPPVVECRANRPVVFFWDRLLDDGTFQNFYYTTYYVPVTGFIFTTNPGQVRVSVRDREGNVAVYHIKVISDYQRCEPPMCRRVRA
jgi:hypothetical protein